MNQPIEYAATCPGCGCIVSTDDQNCGRCNWRLKVDASGRVVSAISLDRAGKARKRPAYGRKVAR